MDVPSLETLGFTVTGEWESLVTMSVPFGKSLAEVFCFELFFVKGMAEEAARQLPLVTIEEVKLISSKLGPPLVLVLVGTNWIWLFPATKGTVAVKVPQVSQLVVGGKFTVKAVDTLGPMRLMSMGRAVVVPLE